MRAVFVNNTTIEEIIIFGSRAKGNFQEFSDIDLAIMNPVSFDILLRLETQIDDLLLPHEVDLIQFNAIENEALRDHIQQKGKIFYRK